jgi:DNA-binding MarR family transcriptional regulator
MLFRDTRTRIIEFIKELKEDVTGTIQLINGEILVNNPYSQGEIAKLVGTSRPTFNIIINELEKEGRIAYQKNKILLKKSFLLDS